MGRWIYADGYSWNEAPLALDKDGDGEVESLWLRKPLFDVFDIHSLLPFYDDKDYPPRGNDSSTWLALLKQGSRFPAVVNSGAYENYHGCGWVRNYIQSQTDEPSNIRTMDVVRTLKKGRCFMTTAPFLEVEARSESGTSATFGDTLISKAGRVELSIRVQCPEWVRLDRVRVLKNSTLDPKLDFPKVSSPELFRNGIAQFDHSIDIVLDRDTYFIVIAMGRGRNMHRRDGEPEEVPHIADSNPIWVDVGGDGFEPHPPWADRVRPKLTVVRFPAEHREAIIRITLQNVSHEKAEGVFSLRILPRGIARVLGKNNFGYSIPAGKKIATEARIQLNRDFFTDLALREKEIPSSLRVYIPRNGYGSGLSPTGVEVMILKEDIEDITNLDEE